MATLNRVFAVLLWALASFALILGTLGAVSASDMLRFATVSDNSAAPLASDGSLAIAMRVAADTVHKGDLVLVGAHSAQGATLGEVVDITTSKAGNRSVTLKAPNRVNPDQWSYELGASTYKAVLAVPLIGKVFALANRNMNPWLFGVLSALLSIVVLVVVRFAIFARADHDSDRWFKKLPKGYQDSVDNLIGYFTEQGLEAPTPHEKKRRGRIR